MDDEGPRAITEEITTRYREFVRFAAAIGEMEESEFDNGLMRQLKQINDMARAVPSDATHLETPLLFRSLNRDRPGNDLPSRPS